MEWSEDLMAPDKVLHAAGGAGIAAMTMQFLPPRPTIGHYVLAYLPAVLAGIGKEIYDHQHPDRHTADGTDAVATIAGGLAGLTITLRW